MNHADRNSYELWLGTARQSLLLCAEMAGRAQDQGEEADCESLALEVERLRVDSILASGRKPRRAGQLAAKLSATDSERESAGAAASRSQTSPRTL